MPTNQAQLITSLGNQAMANTRAGLQRGLSIGRAIRSQQQSGQRLALDQQRAQFQQSLQKLDLLRALRSNAPVAQRPQFDSLIQSNLQGLGIQVPNFNFDTFDEASADLSAIGDQNPEMAQNRILDFAFNALPEEAKLGLPELQRRAAIAGQDQTPVRRFKAAQARRQQVQGQVDEISGSREFGLLSVAQERDLDELQAELDEPIDPNLRREFTARQAQNRLLRSIPADEATAILSDIARIESGAPLDTDAKNKALNVARAVELAGKKAREGLTDEEEATLSAINAATGISDKLPVLSDVDRARVKEIDSRTQVNTVKQKNLEALASKNDLLSAEVQNRLDVFDGDTESKIRFQELERLTQLNQRTNAQTSQIQALTRQANQRLDSLGLSQTNLIQNKRSLEVAVAERTDQVAQLEKDLRANPEPIKQAALEALKLDLASVKDAQKINDLSLEFRRTKRAATLNQIRSVTEQMQTRSRKLRQQLLGVNSELDSDARAKNALTSKRVREEDTFAGTTRIANSIPLTASPTQIQQAINAANLSDTVQIDDVLEAQGRKAGTDGGSGLKVAKDQQALFNSVVREAGRISGQTGLNISFGSDGGLEFSQGQIQDPAALSEAIRTVMSAQEDILPPTVKQALTRFAQQLGSGQAASTQSRPPQASVQESENRLRNLLK